MPRKEGPPIEERLQRAKELFEFKQKKKHDNLQQLYASRIYKFARKSSIAFIWITQLILIDWALPYKKEYDVLATSNFNKVTRPNQELFLNTAKGIHLEVEFPLEAKRPSAGDSITIYKSLLLRDTKKIAIPAVQENFLITTAITYRLLPLLLIGAVLACAFVFVKNIEVKIFAWIVSIYTCTTGSFFVYYIISSFL